MPFLVIAGITVEVMSDGAAEDEPEIGGEDVYAMAGNIRTIESWSKRKWNFTTGYMTQAQYNTLRAAVAGGAHVNCSGDALGGTVLCRVRIRGAAYHDLGGLDFARSTTLNLYEV